MFSIQLALFPYSLPGPWPLAPSSLEFLLRFTVFTNLPPCDMQDQLLVTCRIKHLVRLLKDLRQRFEGFAELSVWMIDLLVPYFHTPFSSSSFHKARATSAPLPLCVRPSSSTAFIVSVILPRHLSPLYQYMNYIYSYVQAPTPNTHKCTIWNSTRMYARELSGASRRTMRIRSSQEMSI